ncbi:MAG: CHAD domain-containing protein [Chloroflexi bacterium]|nr:CHAD domain-containing protein [Chloroflexota bacterium]
MEVELKYQVLEPETGERLLRARSIAGFRPRGRVRPVATEDRYLDTADGSFGHARIAVRLRTTAVGRVLTIKGETTTDGALHRREEREGPAGDGLDPAAWPESDARSLLMALAGDAPLHEVVGLRQARRYRVLADGTGTEVELALDQVEVVAGERSLATFTELELELKAGDPERLAALRDALAVEAGLEPLTTSKLERALAALAADKLARADAEPPPAAEPSAEKPVAEPVAAPAPAEPQGPPRLVVGKTPGVLADDTIAEAGRRVFRFHLARMLAKEAGTRSGKDPEDLHDMRVATRRMRAAWRVFGDGYRAARTRRLRGRLRTLATRLGAVRDLDVLIGAAEGFRDGLPPAAAEGFEPLLDSWREQRATARVALLEELNSGDYRRLVEEYRVFVLTEGAAAVIPASPTIPHRVRDTAASRIWAAYEQVRAYEPVLRWADLETLHELRIAGKWLRYTLEFYREALGPDAAVLIPRVVAVQDHLGWLHDAEVSAALTRSFLVADASRLTPAQVEAIAGYLRAREQEMIRLRRTFGRPWRGVAGSSFRRLLGRTLTAL